MSKKNYRLGLTCFSDHYEKMQLVKCELLKNSVDESVKKIYKAREKINSNFTRAWKATNVAKTASAEVELDLKFPTQATQQGLEIFIHSHPFQKSVNLSLPRLPLFESMQELYTLHHFQDKVSGFIGQNLHFLLIFHGKISSGEMSVLR